MADIDEITETLSILDDWEERYRYVIDLGRTLQPLPDDARNEANKVRGCASQVWLESRVEPGPPARLSFRGDSDAHIVRGLVAIVIAIYSGRPAADIAGTDALAIFDRLGLREHLSPQRSNGLRSMVDRIRRDAGAVAAGAAVS